MAYIKPYSKEISSNVRICGGIIDMLEDIKNQVNENTEYIEKLLSDSKFEK